ncbi:MAG: imidazole glycerol phosphate synthase subunit HisH [Gemmatimonadetes bacterium]|jgi:glutamine amidotransferase|nr:imidazole glycerol phosphate synthase subunit HisH [Gemmatimonadota bacterium]MBT4611522.1 imidazole glycerol phosphate synthase subunit HisH [Gemmatimonadota bacterium]MBT5058372.1 imidazole glycerol phosphate synthase subunit HisH [Gemmatimonadota bacterium]MBT5146915.1 imidazole glycerol phosphate synthase subunit HisH [Gemmatimonadota bacterium]MBT5591190.1 imidazole glycerol phosphate synthase subunit HisH [Gemmatimonadota bacterium]
MIAVIDYGMGNLRSVEKAFQYLGHDAKIITDAGQLADADHLVLPGDAAFGDAMRNLREGGWDQRIHDHVDTGRPFLGICVGLQLMFGGSEEMGQHTGLGLLPGKCVRFPTSEKVPQIGWNQIERQVASPLLEGVEDGSFFYFVHSYYVEAEQATDQLATTDYGIQYTSIAGRDNVYGVQFHPEKSQKIGLRLLTNFASFN